MAYSLEALIFGKKREISDGTATLIPDVVVSEEHVDEVTLTRHPVDVGAPISDHAFVNSATLRVQFGWSTSASLVNSVLSGSILKGLNSPEEVYAQLVALMEKRQRLSISTGKRAYTDMVLTKVQTTTTVDTENSLLIDLTFEKVFVVNAETLTLTTDQVVSPEKHGGTVNRGSPWALSGR